MELKLIGLNTWASPSHCMIGEDVFWGSIYYIDKEECFGEGVNVLVGGITKGGWSLTYSLAFPQKYLESSERVPIMINNKKCSLKKLEKVSFYVGDCTARIFLDKTAKELIFGCAKKWRKKRLMRLLDELEIDTGAECFCKFPMRVAGKNVWKYSVALGILLKKRIFLFPWISSPMLEEIQEDIVNIGKALTRRKLILLLPLEEDDILQKTNLEYERCILTQVCGESMQRERVNGENNFG